MQGFFSDSFETLTHSFDIYSKKPLPRQSFLVVQQALNKGEAMNGLARAICFGKHGELRERALRDQLQRASALNILINAISVWNTVYLTKAMEFKKAQGGFQQELLHHISPLGWEHINFLGEYSFDLSQPADLHTLRPLRSQNVET